MTHHETILLALGAVAGAQLMLLAFLLLGIHDDRQPIPVRVKD